MTFNERAAIAITRVVSGMPFFWCSCVGIAAWMAWNLWGPVAMRFDPAPAFVLLLMVLNIGQWLFLSALGNGQAVLSRSGEARAAHEARVVDRLEAMDLRILALQEDAAQERAALRTAMQGIAARIPPT